MKRRVVSGCMTDRERMELYRSKFRKCALDKQYSLDFIDGVIALLNDYDIAEALMKACNASINHLENEQ